MVRARVKGKVRVRVKVSAIAHFTPQKVHVSCSPTFFPDFFSGLGSGQQKNVQEEMKN